jgi:DNA-binding transcriptional regulator YiaG
MVRTPAELRAARDFLGLSAEGLARMLGVEDGRTVRRWEAGERELPGWVIVMMETALSYTPIH